MSTRDITPPNNEKKGDVKRGGDRMNTRAYAEKTRYGSITESIHATGYGDRKKKNNLLLISEPVTEKRNTLHNITPFILALVALGLITVFSFIGLNVNAQKTKTIDFYLSEAKAASRRLKEGAELFSRKKFGESGDRFLQAENSLRAIDKQLWFVPVSSSFSFVDPRLRSARAAFQATIHLAKTGEESSLLAEQISPYLSDPHSLPIPITQYLSEKRPTIEEIVNTLAVATSLVNQIDANVLPKDFVDEYTKAYAALSTITQSAQKITANFDGIMDFLGAKNPHTILVVLQNSSELRPTGGFIGNVALVELTQGKLSQQQVIDVYSFDHKLNEIIAPPNEIKTVNNRWFMRDSNTSLDFPTSAKNIALFLEREGGPKVDTVITIDQSVVENLLRVTGPLKIPELSSELTSENFERVLSFIVEAKIYGREDPKVLLKSLLPALQTTTIDSKKSVEVYQVLSDAILSKHSMAYSSNKNIEDLIRDFGADGTVKAPQISEKNDLTTQLNDFFAVAHYSIGGNKTDEYMKEKITHNTYIDEDGSVIDEVSIKRANTWTQKNEDSLRKILSQFGFKEIPPHVLSILGKSWNIHMLRVYAPLGSVLIDNSNMVSTYEDLDIGATYFSARLDVAAGDNNTLTLRYKLPQKVAVKNTLLSPAATLAYDLNIIKHPGQDGVLFEKNIFPANGLHVLSNAKNTFTLTRDTNLHELIVR